MIPLYTPEEFKLAKGKQLLPLQCKYCKETYYRSKHRMYTYLNPNSDKSGNFCSNKCVNLFRSNGEPTHKPVICMNCNKQFLKRTTDIKSSPNHFCGHSCNASYYNRNKTYGYRRSKLEIWLEEQLPLLYPNINFIFNDRKTIGLELDIYIPDLNIAFELNGIVHYEPIYGVKQHNKVKNNDKSKSLSCHKAKIDLCVIDTSKQKYVKPETSQKYLDIITKIIDERIVLVVPTEIESVFIN